MYVPGHFNESRPEVMHGLIRASPLAVLVTAGKSGLEANHVPFYLQVCGGGTVTLSGHVARANPVWNQGAATSALAIFQGPAGYISPGWYPAKKEHGKVVPTWNYVTVHAHGKIRFREDPDWIRAQMERLTNQMESGRPEPWAVSDAPADFTDKLVANVVGVELAVERMVGKWKLSQNQSETNRAGVVKGLEAEEDATSAALARLVAEYSSAAR